MDEQKVNEFGLTDEQVQALSEAGKRGAAVGRALTQGLLKAKDTTHSYIGWRDRLDGQHRAQLARLERRAAQTEAPVLTDDQMLIILLVTILDEGGETTEYIRDLFDAE